MIFGKAYKLDSIESSIFPRIDSPDKAVAYWWGKAILNPTFDFDRPDQKIVTPLDQRVIRLELLGPLMADFVRILADRSKADTYGFIRVDYVPDRILTEAATQAGILEANENGMGIYPLKSFTNRDGKRVTARMGLSGERTQIWPPTMEAMQPSVAETIVQAVEAGFVK